MGLDDVLYGTVRSNLLATNPLPSLNRVYATLIQEKRVKEISRTKEERGEVNGLTVQIGGRTRGRGDAKDKSTICGHCNRTRHDATNYFQVVGYPKWSFQWRNDSTSDGYTQGRTDRFEQ